jgi:hypothetical protein
LRPMLKPTAAPLCAARQDGARILVGSGPIRFMRSEWVPRAKAVFEKFAGYARRQEQPSCRRQEHCRGPHRVDNNARPGYGRRRIAERRRCKISADQPREHVAAETTAIGRVARRLRRGDCWPVAPVRGGNVATARRHRGARITPNPPSDPPRELPKRRSVAMIGALARTDHAPATRRCVTLSSSNRREALSCTGRVLTV